MSSLCTDVSRFQPHQRATLEELHQQGSQLSADQFPFKLLDSIPTLLAILNPQRQIVFANQALVELIGADNIADFIGRRPGEVFACEHSNKMPSGCGGSEACCTCGAALALFGAEAGHPQVAECRMTRLQSGQLEALEMEIWAKPLDFNGGNFTVIALTDVSHRKWRGFMEKLFFHDVLNIIGSIKGFTELLLNYDPCEKEEIYSLLHLASRQVIDQVQAFRTLSAAESRELNVHYEQFSVHEFLDGVAALYRHHDAAQGRVLEFQHVDPDFLVSCDRVLLSRILGNMLLNAFEATAVQDTVTLSCDRQADEVRFSVQNPGVIPRQVQLQIFQRAYSTKGPGRGLGTYSLRLLSEYLGGRVTFESNATVGTIFTASYPIKLS